MIERRPLDLKTFAGEVLNVLRRTIPENVHLTLETEPGPFVVEADAGRMQQVLTNLALNARDAMPGGGELRIGLEWVEVPSDETPPVADMPLLAFPPQAKPPSRPSPPQARTPPRPSPPPAGTPSRPSPPPAGGIEGGVWACLSVSDTGTGMTEEVRSHLFEPFFTTKEAGEGTGLGLAQVYGIVRQHGGYIGVETEVGRGTTVSIYLPACEAEEENKKEKVSTVPQGQGETILLVEDNERLLKAGQELLESLGYRVLTAANGRQALEVYKAEGGADLVITDLVMPEMGGKKLVQELRKTKPTLKALGITGYVVEEVTRELRATGFLGVVHKPFEIDGLAHAIRRALDKRE